MSEKFPYNLEKAQEEAAKMPAKIKSGGAGEAKDYTEAEKLVGEEEKKAIEKMRNNILEKIKENHICIVKDLLPSIPPEHHKMAALEMIKHDKTYYGVAENLDKFSLDDETRRQIAQELVHMKKAWAISQNFEKFEKAISEKELINSLIDEKSFTGIFRFRNLEKDIAEKLIENGQIINVARYNDTFIGLNHNELADKLIDTGEEAIKFIKCLSGLNEKIAEKLVSKKEGFYVSQCLEIFQDKTLNKKFFEEIINWWSFDFKEIIKNKNKFQDLNFGTAEEIPHSLINAICKIFKDGNFEYEEIDEFLTLLGIREKIMPVSEFQTEIMDAIINKARLPYDHRFAEDKHDRMNIENAQLLKENYLLPDSIKNFQYLDNMNLAADNSSKNEARHVVGQLIYLRKEGLITPDNKLNEKKLSNKIYGCIQNYVWGQADIKDNGNVLENKILELVKNYCKNKDMSSLPNQIDDIFQNSNITEEILKLFEDNEKFKKAVIEENFNEKIEKITKDRDNVIGKIKNLFNLDNQNAQKLILAGYLEMIGKLFEQEKNQSNLLGRYAEKKKLEILKKTIEEIIFLRNSLNIPHELITNNAINRVSELIASENIDEAIYVIDQLSASRITQSALIKEKVENLIVDYINKDAFLQYYDELISKLGVTKESLSSPKIQLALKSLIIRFLDKDNKYYDIFNKIMDIKSAYPITDIILEDEHILQLAGEYVINYISESKFSEAEQLKNIFNVQEEFIAKYFEQMINLNKWEVVVKMQHHFSGLKPLYENFLNQQKEIANDTSLKYAERQKAINILAGLIKNGEVGIIQKFSEIISSRAKQKEISESKWGLDPTQETAFHTLMRLDNSDSNDALFNLLFNDNVNIVVKYAVFKKLISEKLNFLNEYNKDALKTWLYSKKAEELNWQDLEFVRAVSNEIPSTELRNLSKKYIGWSIKKISREKESINEIWEEKYSNIPKNTFLQIYHFVSGDEISLDKFQKLYTAIKKENAKKDNLLYGIVNSLETEQQMLGLMIGKLKEIDFSTKEDAYLLSELLRQFVFLNKIEDIKNYRHSESDEENLEEHDQEAQTEKQQLPSEILKIFSKEVKTLKELITIIKEVTTKKIQEVLPNENITGEKIEALEKGWGNLEPIFTYLGRYPQLKEYIAEMAANFDSQKNWKNWRYGLKNKSVKNQIGHLSDEQLETWKEDYFSEIGDIMITESGSDKPRQIQNILQDAIMTHKHIFNPELGQNKFEHVQKTIESVHGKINESPNKKEIIIEESVKEITTDTKSIDAVINFNNLPRIKQSLENIIPEDVEIQINKKTKDTINFLMAYLPKELSKTFDENYKQFGDGTKIKSEELITLEIRNAFNEKIKEIEASHTKVLDSDIWERLGLDKNNLKNAGQFYQKRQELKATIDLLRLNNLSNKLIATNKIAEKEGKKGGETIIGVIDTLKKFFKDSPLLLDLKNIEFALKEKIDFGEKRRLAMMFTDNPQMLWLAGKYPLGNGSCQHYAEGGYANQLMGYVGDANCKVAYLVDLNKLSADIKQGLGEKGFEEIKDNIPAQELLNASLARSIVKMTKDKDNKPVILLEPTYTVVYKGDASMDKYYNIFIDLFVADPMKAKMARGEGKESVSKGSSRSPEGQYEDLNLSNVKFIHKLSKPTKEDEDIMERIRSSR